MKLHTLLPTVAFAALVMVPALSQDREAAEFDPFAPDPPRDPNRPLTPEERFEMLPKLIQVQVEWIEMRHEVVTDLMFLRDPKGDSTELRKEVQELVKEGEAEIVETAICLARPGQKATTESIHEFIYPTGYAPAAVPNDIRIREKVDAAALSQLIIPSTPTAFQTRNLGTTLEIEANVGADSRVIELRFSPEIVVHTGEARWQSVKDSLGNENHIAMPLFYTMRTSTGLVTRDGQYRFVGLMTPHGDDGEADRSRKLMMFLKCDVVAIEEETIEGLER